MKVTADNLTDEQIREERKRALDRKGGEGLADALICAIALRMPSGGYGGFPLAIPSASDTEKCRAAISAAINARREAERSK